MSASIRIAVLGLGEAGDILATDLAAVADVVGFDPARDRSGAAYAVADSAAACVADSAVVMALTAAPDASALLDSVFDSLPSDAVYADFSSSSPGLKAELAEKAATRGIRFVDAVLMSPVPRERIATPTQAAGSGAARLAELLNPLGMRIEVIGDRAGDAAARKLLRSIMVKGLTALLIESLRTADALELADWFSEHISETLTTITPEFLTRLLDGTSEHSVRRVHEMIAAVEMVRASGGVPNMTEATVKVLESAPDGIPRGSAF
jgi:3-hydroxyisobutyrate dehydrogenase-like beta-hydroxyacid dehydrogenase